MKSFLVDQDGYYGEFGGAYVPEILHKCVEELTNKYLEVIESEEFKKEFEQLLRDYVGRPSPLYLAKRLSEKYGCKLYLKREDLNHTGAHKINNTIGQILLARRMGKKRIIAEDTEQEDETRLLPPLKKGQVLHHQSIIATERFTQHPPRYTEASLVRKLEELGIGRPSTYAPTISTIQQRGYVEKGEKSGEERSYNILSLQDSKITDVTQTEITGAEKAKLMPTDTGTVVNDFLMEYFPNILDYNFTASVEKQFDEIAEGEKKWTAILKDFYKGFHPSVENTLATKNAHKAGERILGEEPGSGKQVSVKIGRFGPVVQIGTAGDNEKPRFAQLKKDMSIETITLEEALELFKLPRTLGEYEGKTVTIGTGRYGPYVHNNGMYTSLPKTIDPLEITLAEAIQLIREKKDAEAQKHIKKFEEEPELEILNGRYGPYISYKGNNYKIPKDIIPQDLNLDACREIIKLQSDPDAPKAKRGKYAKKKK